MIRSLYVQVEVGFPRSKLVDRAMATLGLDRDQAMGKLVRLWMAVLQTSSAASGSLAERSDDWIEEEVGWRGERGAFARFVRQQHLADDGTIAGWQEKYAALNKKRGQARDRQRRHRSKQHEEPQARDGNAAGDAAVTRDITRDVRVTDTVTPLTSSSSSRSSHSNGKKEQQNARSDLGFTAEEIASFGPHWPHVEGMVRAAKNPAATRATILAHVTGLDYPQSDPLVVGIAVREYLASGQAFNAKYFAGFVRDAAKLAQRTTSAKQADREIAHLDREAVDRERAKREEADMDDLLTSYERTHGEHYAVLLARAEGSIGRSGSGAFRKQAVRALLAKLIREEVARGKP